MPLMSEPYNFQAQAIANGSLDFCPKIRIFLAELIEPGKGNAIQGRGLCSHYRVGSRVVFDVVKLARHLSSVDFGHCSV